MLRAQASTHLGEAAGAQARSAEHLRVGASLIADLLAPEVRLVVEVDGGYHATRQRADARRDRALERAGYRVLRLEAELVMSDLAEAVGRVRAAVEELRGGP